MTDLLWYILVSDFLLMQLKVFGNNVGVVVVAQSTESHSCSTDQNWGQMRTHKFIMQKLTKKWGATLYSHLEVWWQNWTWYNLVNEFDSNMRTITQQLYCATFVDGMEKVQPNLDIKLEPERCGTKTSEWCTVSLAAAATAATERTQQETAT